MHLPTGTVTFVFTDIEGSTRLLKQLGDTEYATLLAVHRRLVREIFTAHEGRPHWGKIHTLDSSYFAKTYERFADFVTVRDELDPNRTFTNDYLDKVLG